MPSAAVVAALSTVSVPLTTATTEAPEIATASASVIFPAIVPLVPSVTVMPWPVEPTVTVWVAGASVPSATPSS